MTPFLLLISSSSLHQRQRIFLDSCITNWYSLCTCCYCILRDFVYSVEPLNTGNVKTRHFVLYREVVLSFEFIMYYSMIDFGPQFVGCLWRSFFPLLRLSIIKQNNIIKSSFYRRWSEENVLGYHGNIPWMFGYHGDVSSLSQLAPPHSLKG